MSDLQMTTAIRTVEGYGLLQQGSRQSVLSDAQIRHPKVGFYVFRDRWNAIEPKQGKRDASYIVSQIKRARAAGKKYVLAVMTGESSTPDWVPGDRAKGKEKTCIVPWAPELPQHYRALHEYLREVVVAPGVKIGDDPNCGMVWDNGPTVPSQELHTNGMEKAKGFTAPKMLGEWKASIDIITELYPGVSIVLSLSGQTPVKAYQPQVIDYFIAKAGVRATFQFNSLSGHSQRGAYHFKAILDLHHRGFRVGAEMVEQGETAGWAKFPERDFVVIYPKDEKAIR
jgi:hypothetical protein